MLKKILSVILVLLLALLGISAYLTFFGKRKADTPETAPEEPAAANVMPAEEPEVTPEPEPTIDPALFTDTDSLLIVANKKHKLPDGYVPADLVTPDLAQTAACTMRAPAAEAIAEMKRAAAEDGVYLMISSAYRGEDYQRSLYNDYSASYGTETADTISSRPGYSDHQTGLAADFVEGDGSLDGTNFNQSFEDTKSGQWLRVHAHEYGFIMRYPREKEDITGFMYEPWHVRFVGDEVAKILQESGQVLEEYLEITSAYAQ